MTKEERDKLIVEELGGCWHDKECCRECGKQYDDSKHIKYGQDLDNPLKHEFDDLRKDNLDLSTPNGFFWMWNKIVNRGWFREFSHDFCKAPRGYNVFPNFYINPDRLMDALAEFLGQEKK